MPRVSVQITMYTSVNPERVPCQVIKAQHDRGDAEAEACHTSAITHNDGIQDLVQDVLGVGQPLDLGLVPVSRW